MKNLAAKNPVCLPIALAILLARPLSLHALDDIFTDWLNATEGSSGEVLGAEVIQVQQLDDDIIIDVDIPNDDLHRYENIVVIGKRSNQPVKLTKQPEILNDTNGKAFGIRFQIKRLPTFDFRLRLYDDNQDATQ